MPPQNQLSWRPRSHSSMVLTPNLGSQITPRNLPSGISSVAPSLFPTRDEEQQLWAPLTGAAFADGLLAGLPVVQAISHIDPFVLKAIESSTADHIHSFPSVHSYVEQHFFAAPAMTADGWFERLTGYVAEQKAASALEAAGHHVSFAATANQPVWDLLVDGHPVQIKEGISGVHAFLGEHYGIPIYTGHEVAAAVKDPLVHGLAGLGGAQIHEITHDTLDNVSDAFDPGFHFPLVTLAFAAYREAKLLLQEHTTLSRAAAHVGLDVAGVGAGAFGGAKAGALAGAFFGPIGAAIGGLVGAVAGGVGGKMLSTSIRHIPFENAKSAYEGMVDSAQAALGIAVDRSRDQVRQLQSTYQTRYAETRQQIEWKALGEIRQLTQGYDSHFLHFAEGFTQHLEELTANLKAQENEVLSSVPGSGLRGVFVPYDNDHLRSAIRLWFRKARKTVRHEQKRFRELQPRTAESLRAEVQRFLGAYVFELESLQHELVRLMRAFELAQQKANSIADLATADLETNRNGLIVSFASHVERLHSGLIDLLESWNRKVARERENFRREARAVGVDI
jgi:hypothetical protein